VSKFIPEHKDISSELNSQTPTESTPSAQSQADLQEEEKAQRASEQKQLTPGKQRLQSTLNGIKRFSGAVVYPFTGPLKLHRRPWFWLGMGVSAGAIALGYEFHKLDQSLNYSTTDVFTFVRPGTITIKAVDGTILQQIGPATHDSLKFREIPKQIIQAFLATEDRRFYEHTGVDFQGIGRAIVTNLQSGHFAEGASTITQQLARIVYFDQERSLGRKLKEMRMAQKIEYDVSKEQILERYLNLVYLGEGGYGIADAAWIYFSKQVKDLTLPEVAMLAGLPAAPTEYSPFVNGKAAKQRRDEVLRRMQEAGYITPAQATEAIATPIITKRSNPKRLERKANYFTEYVQQELPKFVSQEVLAKKGLTIETSLKLNWQSAAEKAVLDTVERDGYNEGFEQAAMVAIEPRTGEIKAMVGGKDFFNQQFNRVTQAQRQPGSTFKPFVYGTAIAAGISPTNGYLDAPISIGGYKPKNYGDKYRGWVNIPDALTSSINVVAVKTLIDVGWDPIIEVAQKMGIESKLNPTFSLALGASEVNLLELTNAYGTFAANGVRTKAHGIRRIRDQQGKVIYDADFKAEPALDADTSATITWMLRNVVNDGTGRAAKLARRPVAGKTGTSDEARDLWFIGYIPQMVAGVWLGNDNNRPTYGASGTAALTWNRFMSKVVEGMKVEDFPERPYNIDGRKPPIKAQPITNVNIRHLPLPTEKKPSKEESPADSNSESR
jgi:penicillin-binding protein 1A